MGNPKAPLPDLSILVPLYNEAESLAELSEWIGRVLADYGNCRYELIFIDDGSDDASWRVIQRLSNTHAFVRGIRLAGNCGKSAALDVGFRRARAKVVITMDADLQDSPDEIPALYELIAKEGYHLVSGWKRKRHDPIAKRWMSRLFNRVTRIVSGIPLHDFNCGLKAYDTQLVRHLRLYGEMHRYIPLMAKWAGFHRIIEKEVHHYPRRYGKSKYGWKRLLHGFLDLLSISFVTRFKRRPMHFFGLLGTLSFLFGIGTALYLIIEKLYKLSHDILARDVVDQPLFYLSLVAVIVGIQLFLSGFLAEMLYTLSAREEYGILDEAACEDEP